MRTCSRLPFLVAFVLLLAPPRAAYGDPITAVFTVDINQRYDSLTRRIEPFEAQFTLRMSFDPAAEQAPDPDIRTYGAVTFSPVPLPLRSPASELPTVFEYSFTQHFRAYDGPVFGWRVQSAAVAETHFGSADETYTRLVELDSTHRFTTMPVLSPETFPLHLGGPAAALERAVFAYSGTYRASGIFLESYSYWGTATLTGVETPVIPEPATLALVGGGLLMLVRRRTRVV